MINKPLSFSFRDIDDDLDTLQHWTFILNSLKDTIFFKSSNYCQDKYYISKPFQCMEPLKEHWKNK